MSYHGVAQRVDAVGDHSLKQLAQLEERGGDGGAHLKEESREVVVFCLKFASGMTYMDGHDTWTVFNRQIKGLISISTFPTSYIDKISSKQYKSCPSFQVFRI